MSSPCRQVARTFLSGRNTMGNNRLQTDNLAARINTCFEMRRAPNAPPLSNSAAARAITAHTGVPISATYLWQMRKGLKTNPTMAHVKAIAAFLGVPAMYLVDDDHDPRLEADLVLLHELRQSGALEVLPRVAGLSPQTLSAVACLLDHLRTLEKLPPTSPAHQRPR